MFFPMVLLVTAVLLRVEASPRNAFESTRGCLQFNSDSGYYTDHPFFATSEFQNMETDEGRGVTRMRFGVLGDKHAAIRFTSVSSNSETPMTEIALAHWEDTRTDIRKYPRTVPKKLNSVHLGEFKLRDVMSIFAPTMMTAEMHRNGYVTVTKDGEFAPFLQFNDPGFSFKYIGFAKWNVPVAFFYDCPLIAGGGPNEVGSNAGCPVVQQDCSKCANARCPKMLGTPAPATESPCEAYHSIQPF